MHKGDETPPAAEAPARGYAMTFTPTRLQRALRWFGFDRGAMPELPDDVTTRLPYWMKTVIRIRFDWRDRLRILATGRIHVVTVYAMEHDRGEVRSATAVSVRSAQHVGE